MNNQKEFNPSEIAEWLKRKKAETGSINMCFMIHSSCEEIFPISISEFVGGEHFHVFGKDFDDALTRLAKSKAQRAIAFREKAHELTSKSTL